MSLRELSREQARRIAVPAQLLADPPVRDLLEVVRHLTLLQSDPVTAVAPSAELVLWGRLGSSFEPADLESAWVAGSLVELDLMLRPAEDLALFRAEMTAWPGPGPLTEWQETRRDWMIANADARRDVLDTLSVEGAMPASELPDTTVLPWESSGWNNDRSLRRMLDMMVARGEIAAAGMEGRERVWDLAERVYPDDPVVPIEEAVAIRNRRRLRALGIARSRSTQMPNEPNDVGECGEPAVIEGVRGTWRVDPVYLEGDVPHRTVLLSPIDRLVIDRKRMAEIFCFDYKLEMFKPVAKRRWGYWALPILVGDRLVGKLDATSDRDAGVLLVHAVHEDGRWPRRTREGVEEQVDALADWLGLTPVRERMSSPGHQGRMPSGSTTST